MPDRENDRLRAALAAAAARLERLADTAHMTEWSRSAGETEEIRARLAYAREGAAGARAALKAAPTTGGGEPS